MNTRTKQYSSSAATRRQRAHRVAFVLALIALFALVQELLFRGMFPLPEVMGFNRARYQMMAGSKLDQADTIRQGLVYDRILFESSPDGYNEVHQLNVYGFRGPDFSIDPSPGRRRVLVIGDSVAEGQGAPESATISAELSRLMERDGISAEVLNLGVVAAALPHSAMLGRDATALLHPTDVIFVVNANDLPAPNFPPELHEQPAPFPRRSTSWWVPRSVELIGRVARGEPIYRRWFHPAMRFFVPAPDPINPWTGSKGPPPGLDEAVYRAMVAGTLNPWLTVHLQSMPSMLAYNFSEGGLPVLFLLRVSTVCKAVGARMMVVYVPYYGVTHPRYAQPLVALGMDRQTAERLATDPIYRNQSKMLKELCPPMGLPLADTSDVLIRAETKEGPQFWSYDSHPRPSGYITIARKIHEVWRQSFQQKPATVPRSDAAVKQ